MARRMNIFLKQGCLVWFFFLITSLLILGQQCTMLLYSLFCRRQVAFQRTRLKELFGASGVAISANRPQVESLSQGISFPSVPVNGSCKSPTEAAFPMYWFPHSPICAVMIPLVLQSPLSLPGHRRLEYLMCSSKGFRILKKPHQNNYVEKEKKPSYHFNVTEEKEQSKTLFLFEGCVYRNLAVIWNMIAFKTVLLCYREQNSDKQEGRTCPSYATKQGSWVYLQWVFLFECPLF